MIQKKIKKKVHALTPTEEEGHLKAGVADASAVGAVGEEGSAGTSEKAAVSEADAERTKAKILKKKSLKRL